MKKLFEMGDSWRVAFKRTMWISVVVFEILGIVVSVWVKNNFIKEDAFLVLAIILVTFLNETIHSLWACAAYMFEDIARNREASERIAQLLEIQEKRLSGEESEEVPALARVPSVSSVSSVSSSGNSRILSVSERIAKNENGESAPAQWECRECGTMNPMTASFCKDCGKYK